MKLEAFRKHGRRRRLIATYVPAALVLLLGLLTMIGLRREHERDSWVMHTQRVQLALERTLSDVRDAEVGQRGFFITGDTTYLRPYVRGATAFQRRAEEVVALTADNPLQHQRAIELHDMVTRRTVVLEENAELGADAYRSETVSHARLNAGRAMMDSLRHIVVTMIAAEDTLLSRRQAHARRQERATILVVLTGTVLAAVLALYINMFLRSQAQAEADLAQELERQRDELMLAKTQLEMRTRAAEDANRAKTDFLRAMSHELRTPLNAIAGYTQLIEMGIRGPVTAEQHDDLARINRSQRHLLSLINDILNFAKLEAGHVRYHIEDVSMPEIITSVDELVRPLMVVKGIAYKCDAGPPALRVRVDREKAVQVLLNLLSNAVKFTPPQGTIELWVERDGDGVKARVRDNGVGIPTDRQAAIFEPFVQVGRTLSDSAEGTGLGLAISRDLARGMGGDLNVNSAPGEGSTFTFTLQAAAQESGSAAGIG
jgi:signal transduction histidine kinase